MVLHVAQGVPPAGVEAGVHALVHAVAGPVVVTVIVDLALHAAAAVRVANPVGRLALADAVGARTSVLGVGTAGVGHAGVARGRLGLALAAEERVADKAADAGADGLVVVASAVGVGAAGPGAGVDALVVPAGEVVGTVVVDGALVSAGGWRAEEAALAAADRDAVDVLADRVGAAGVRLAGISDLLGDFAGRLEVAASVRIAHVAREADALGAVVLDVAVGVGPAGGGGAGVAAVVINASQAVGAVGVDDADGPAVGRRADVPCQTGAGANAVVLLLLAVGAAIGVGAGILDGSVNGAG